MAFQVISSFDALLFKVASSCVVHTCRTLLVKHAMESAMP